jgi:hypothetical protein
MWLLRKKTAKIRVIRVRKTVAQQLRNALSEFFFVTEFILDADLY